MSKRTTPTLIYYFSLLALLSFLLLSTPVEAKSNHHARMIKVRQGNSNTNTNSNSNNAAAANNGFDPTNPFAIENIGDDPNSDPTDTRTAKGGKQTGTAVANGGAANNTAAAQGTDTAAGQGTSTDGGLFGGVTSIIDGLLPTGTDTTATATNTSTSTTATSTTSTTPTTSSTPPAQSTAIVFNSVTVTSTSPSNSETSNAQANVNDAGQNTSAPSNSHIARNTIIVIAAIGGSVVLAVIVWTIFRKMKLGPSEGFEERLNPIDWNPSNNGTPDMSQRRTSVGSNRSFSSADVHSIRTHITNQPNNGYHSNGGFLADIPNHDFTAGPQNQFPNSLAPGGGAGGYADLRRGPSRGPYDTRGAYGGY